MLCGFLIFHFFSFHYLQRNKGKDLNQRFLLELWDPHLTNKTKNFKQTNVKAMSSGGLSLFSSSLSSSMSVVPSLISPTMASSSSSIKGYPRQILGPTPLEIDPNYLCACCERLLREPVQGSCGHRFCQICLKRLIEGSYHISSYKI